MSVPVTGFPLWEKLFVKDSVLVPCEPFPGPEVVVTRCPGKLLSV